MANHEFWEYWLSHASAETIFEWLRNRDDVTHPGKFGRHWHYENSLDVADSIEKLLLERDEPLINLGLALWGDRSQTGMHLYLNGDRTIQKAVMSGRSFRHCRLDPLRRLRHRDELSEYLEALFESIHEKWDLLEALLKNKHIDETEVLDALYSRRDPFNGLTEEQWHKAVLCSLHNPLLRNFNRNVVLNDGSLHNSRANVWRVFETLPVTTPIAEELWRCAEILWVNRAPYDMDVMATIKRWEVESDDVEDKDKFLSELDPFEECRYHLANKLLHYGRMDNSEIESFKNSDDIALRRSYYRGMSYVGLKPEELGAMFEEDKDKFLSEAVHNLSLYCDEAVSRALWKFCHKAGMWKDFESHAKELLQEDFERFEFLVRVDSGLSNFLDEVEPPIVRIDKRQKYLEGQIKKLVSSLVVIRREYKRMPEMGIMGAYRVYTYSVEGKYRDIVDVAVDLQKEHFYVDTDQETFAYFEEKFPDYEITIVPCRKKRPHTEHWKYRYGDIKALRVTLTKTDGERCATLILRK